MLSKVRGVARPRNADARQCSNSPIQLIWSKIWRSWNLWIKDPRQIKEATPAIPFFTNMCKLQSETLQRRRYLQHHTLRFIAIQQWQIAHEHQGITEASFMKHQDVPLLLLFPMRV